MKILLIGNPISSGGHAGKRIIELAKTLDRRGHHVTTYLTRYAGDGRDHINSLSEGMDRTVVVGGDGTLNEIINGLPESSTCPILHFPTGNANLLAKDLKLPHKTDAVANLLENGKIIMADMGVMNDHRFIMVCGMGFDARVTDELKKVRTGKVNNLSYVRPFLRAVKTPSNSPLTVSVDDGAIKAQGASVLVSNVRNYAGICTMAHDAGVLTGCLDVIIFPKEKLSSLIFYLTRAMFSKISTRKDITYIKAQKTVLIQSDAPIPVELDGDFFNRHNDVLIQNKPGTLPLVVPRKFKG